MALERYETLTRLAARLPKDALVMSTYIGAVGFEWTAERDPQIVAIVGKASRESD